MYTQPPPFFHFWANLSADVIHGWSPPQVVLSLASAPNMCRQMVLPASMQQSGAAAHHMTKGSLLPRKELVLDTGWCLGEETAVDFVFLAAKTKGHASPTTSATRTRFSQVTFLDLLTEKKTFLVYKDDKWGGKGIPKAKFHSGYNHLHGDTQQGCNSIDILNFRHKTGG